MSDVAVIGDHETALAFRSVGLRADVPEAEGEIAQILGRMVAEGAMIIFITEEHASSAQNDILKLMDRHEVAILAIPAVSGPTGYGMELVRKMSIRALGADVLFADAGGSS